MQFDEIGKLIVSDDTPVHVPSYDEKPGIQVIATTSDDLIPDERHSTISRDYEYKHLGTLSLLVSALYKDGWRIPLLSVIIIVKHFALFSFREWSVLLYHGGVVCLDVCLLMMNFFSLSPTAATAAYLISSGVRNMVTASKQGI